MAATRIGHRAADVAPSSLLKRTFDVALSGVGLLVSSPLWLVLAAAVKLEDGGDVFYGQERVGPRGRSAARRAARISAVGMNRP